MNVVHVTTVDEGGAYKAVERINECLNQQKNINSVILLRNRINSGHEGDVYLNSPLMTVKSKIRNGINLLLSQGQITNDKLGCDIRKNRYIEEADIVCIHWINSFLSLSTLELLLKTGKRIIIFMHDTWFFTGGCHVTLGCDRYKEKCGCCPLIGTGKEKDLSYFNLKEKRQLFSRYHVQIVGPGNQIVECAKQSAVFRGQSASCIPNPVDLSIFNPKKNIDELKEKYHLPDDKKLVLFGAAFNGIKNREKGFSYLQKALEQLDDSYMLLIFGQADEKMLETLKQRYHLFGYIEEESELAEIYSVADVYVTSSLQESFGYTILESVACGTPVVAFPNGGSNDLIIHGKNGYLAKYQDAKSLADGIQFCTKEENRRNLSQNAVQVSKKYSYRRIGERYRMLFGNNEFI